MISVQALCVWTVCALVWVVTKNEKERSKSKYKKADRLRYADGGKMILKGPMGAAGIQKIATFPVAFALILFTLFVVLNLIKLDY